MTVTAGSIAFVAYSFDDAAEGFAFVALGPIAPGESIRFVDGQWQAGGTIREEASIVWTNTTASAVAAGTIVQVNFTTKGSGNAPNSGFVAAEANVGSVGGVLGPERWNIANSDSLYAITGTPAAPGTVVAGIVWGGTNTTGINAGANLLNLTGQRAASQDVGVLNVGTADGSYGGVAALRGAALNTGNWVFDGSPTGGAGTNAAEWPALDDPNSPLYQQQTITLNAAPAATTTIRLAEDGGASGSDGITANPALTGTVSSGAAGVLVTIKDGATVLGTATTGAGGVWTFANAGAAEGAHGYTAAVTDNLGNTGAFAATSPATVTLDRTPDTGVAIDLTEAAAGPAGASVSFDLAGLDAGSTATVTFTGSGGGSVTRSYASNGAATADVSGLRGDITATVSVFDAAGNASSGTGDTLAADPVCFCPGTLVAVPGGERPVETLRAGDLVLTADGEAKPVRWLGRQTVSTRFGDPLRVLPVRIVAGALGENLPRRDLLVSPDHALLVDGVLVHAGALANGTTIRREQRVPEVFTYWHVELADHSLVLAEGVPAETFIDNVARLAFDNWAEHEAAAAGVPAPVAEMALPRAKAARQVPQATRRRLAERAALLLSAEAAAA